MQLQRNCCRVAVDKEDKSRQAAQTQPGQERRSFFHPQRMAWRFNWLRGGSESDDCDD